MSDMPHHGRGKGQLIRRNGVNTSERYLKHLCDRSFLSLWSYSNVCRRQLFAKNSTQGKEVCDLLVVFENHIIIFSDKAHAYGMNENKEVNWQRWFRQAIEKSAHQVYGAERWIKDVADPLFLDLACTQPLPIALPDLSTAIFHRILVAHGASQACSQEFGGSGSLMIAPRVVGVMHTQKGCQPFTIGQVNPKKGYVHVFDDTTLDIVMKKLDTISDFVRYLTRKERFIQNEQLVWAAGEEDLLAYYLRDINSEGEHDFILPDNYTALAIQEGLWDDFCHNPRRQAQIEADEVSYLWDTLIERFNTRILAGTEYFTTSSTIQQSERGMRLLAREPRTRRRMLASSLLNLIETRPFSQPRTRFVPPSHPGDPYYLFLLEPWNNARSEAQNREFRYTMLAAYCKVLKRIHPDAQDIVGIATETGPMASKTRSEDTLYLDTRSWNDEDESEAEQLQRDFGLLTDIKISMNTTELEYPLVPAQPLPPMKGHLRNIPCPCGSGKKYKKCCGR